MATVQLTKDNFADTIDGTDIVFIDFWAAWCGPCQRFGPVFEAASEANPDVTFAKLDTEANPDVAGALQIQGIPTLMAFRSGKLVYREAGAMTGPMFDKLIQAVRDIDPADLEDDPAEQEGEPVEQS